MPDTDIHSSNDRWFDSIPEEQWEIYRRVIQEAKRRQIPFALGGAFCRAHYTGLWRNTKDIDLYVLPKDREAMIRTVSDMGLRDYYETKPYDRSWIYRAHSGEIIVDTIWAMANARADVDERWIHGGPELEIRGERLRALPVEEIIWDKLFIMQRDRCDWPDALNLVKSAGPTLNWEHLLERLGDDSPLLIGALWVFGWVCPSCAQSVPKWVWTRLNVPIPPENGLCRAKLLDSRPWLTA